MRAVKKKNKKKSIFLRIALIAFSIYVIIMLVQLQVQLNNEKNELNRLNKELAQKEIIVDDLKDKAKNDEAFIEQEAYDQGNAYPNDHIYVDTPGSE